jgi:acetyltransferase
MQNKIPVFSSPEQAVRTFMHLINHERQKEFIETESKVSSIQIKETVSTIFKKHPPEQEWLDYHLAMKVLDAYDIPILKTEFASTAEQAKLLAQKIGFPVALKISSTHIIHKSDVGGVALNLNSLEEVENSANKMLSSLAVSNPNARIDGFILQPMIQVKQGFELLLGSIRDSTFGPVVIFGAGGKAVELIKDKALILAPLNQKSALDLLQQTRIYDQLRGYRDQKPVALEKLIDCLIKLSHILINHPEIQELDINPLIADQEKIIALDCRIRIQKKEKTGAEA